MTDDRIRNWNIIHALEQARAQLELVLEADADWRALREAATPASRAAFRLALAGNPVYRAWDLLGRAIEEMRAERTVRPDRAALGASEPKAGEKRSRVELRHVLERIRSDAALDGGSGQPLTAGLGRATGDGSSSSRAQDAPAIPLPDIEEATVSFVVQEAGPPAPPQAIPGAAPGGEPPAAIPATEAEDDVGDEAEVVIVRRRRD